MKKDYNELAKASLSNQKWDFIATKTAIAYLILMAISAQWIDKNVTLVLVIPALVSVSMLIIFGPNIFPEKDQEKINLYADYLAQLDKLKEERQEHKDFCAENGA